MLPSLEPTSSCSPSSGLIDERCLANFILDYASTLSLPMTHLQLQKILYFCHGWFLARERVPLVVGQFEAWREGPVLRSVYNEFKVAGSQPIGVRALRLDMETGRRVVAVAKLSSELAKYVRTIARLYMGYSAYDLSSMTHAVESPWYEVAHATDSRVNLGLLISNEAIEAYFASGRAPFPRS